MLRHNLIITLSIISLNAFAQPESSVSTIPLMVKSTCEINNPPSSNLYMATKWYRNSSEQKAIYIQTFRLATGEIEKQVKAQKLKPNTWGVVMDIDETILDNSNYQASLVENCSNFSPTTWNNFGKGADKMFRMWGTAAVSGEMYAKYGTHAYVESQVDLTLTICPY